MTIEEVIIEYFKEEGRKEGKEEGEQATVVRVAENCLREGLSIELTSNYRSDTRRTSQYCPAIEN